MIYWFIFKDKRLLSNHPDSIIIAEAVIMARRNKHPVRFMTSDLA